MPSIGISQEAIEALCDYYSSIPDASEQIRRFANSAGLIKSKERVNSLELDLPSTQIRRERVLQYFDKVDWSSPYDIAHVLKFFEMTLRQIKEGSIEFQSITTPLERDGYVYDNGYLRLMSAVDMPNLESAVPRDRLPSLKKQLERIQRGLIEDPASAVGSCKELIESVCKLILRGHQHEISPNADLVKLFKETTTCLHLADTLPEHYIKRILNNLASVAQTIGELRNTEGTGHGHVDDTRLERRHARLVYNATATICTFLLESDALSTSATTVSPSQCWKCGETLTTGDNFCEACGAHVFSSDAATSKDDSDE